MGGRRTEDASTSAAATDDDASGLSSLLRRVAELPAEPPRPPEPDRTGQMLAHYKIRSRLGQGGMGIVYAADDTKLRRKVALKVLPMAMVAHEARRRRFLREARSVSALLHPNLATVFDVGESDGTVFLAMEYIDGVTLRRHLRDRGGRLDPVETMRIGCEVARGLGKAHAAGVVHRDLKPENVMIATDGSVRVLDFGLAKLSEEAELVDAADAPGPLDALASGVLGTPGYMSPEQAAGGSVDARTDVFSFGVMLYEMLSGVRPFEGQTTREVLDAVEREAPPSVRTVARRLPGALVRVVDRCLAKDPEERFADGNALLEQLERMRGAAASSPRPRAVAAASVAIVAGGIGIWFLVRPPAAAPPASEDSPAPAPVPEQTTPASASPPPPVESAAPAPLPSAAAAPTTAGHHSPHATPPSTAPPRASAAEQPPAPAPASSRSGLGEHVVKKPPF